jgi:hypothetical protein
MVTRRALARLRSNARRREEYLGEWLPEPLLTAPDVAEDVELERHDADVLSDGLKMARQAGHERLACGYLTDMSEPDEKRIQERANLTPEEQEAGSDDPEAQAAAILRDSDERVADPEGTRRESTQTPDEPVREEDLNR